MTRIVFLAIVVLINTSPLWAQEKIELSPSGLYDRFIVYETLAIFWAGIIGLIVIIKMKLKEIERIQEMGIDREEKDVPLLD